MLVSLEISSKVGHPHISDVGDNHLPRVSVRRNQKALKE
jgi:hypothetical protein